MNDAFLHVLSDYEQRASRERALQADAPHGQRTPRDELLLAVGPQTGELLCALVKGLGARTIIELGTSYGYSTLWLAHAARATGGEVTSFDVARDKQDYAARQLERAGLREQVEFHTGDALELLRDFDTRIDFVLLDVWNESYVPLLHLLYPKLSRDAVIVADNMLLPEAVRAQAERYREAVRALPHLDSVLLPIGNGLEVSRFMGRAA